MSKFQEYMEVSPADNERTELGQAIRHLRNLNDFFDGSKHTKFKMQQAVKDIKEILDTGKLESK